MHLCYCGVTYQYPYFCTTMKRLFFCLFLLLLSQINAQIFRGQIYMKDDSSIFLNHIYVTNLNTHKTVLSNYIGEFTIQAKPGDVIRFTSIISDRRDIRMTEAILNSPTNFIELKQAYYEIQEVVIRFKPTGHLKTDVLSMKSAEKKLEIAKVVGLPEPKGDGYSPENPPASLTGGGLTFSIDTIYDIITGEQKKKRRLQEYEKMNNNITMLKNYFGNDYFEKIKIPQNLIDNFLQFVYTSDNIAPYIEVGNFEGTQPYIEKYLPIYLKRLYNSHVMDANK